MKRIAVYLDDRFVGYYIGDESLDLRKLKNLIVKRLVFKMMPTIPLTSRKRSTAIYRELLKEIKTRIKLVYEL